MAIPHTKSTANTANLHPHKYSQPTPVGRPIISGYEGSTERISSFVDSLLQPIAKSQKSYLKDTTDFINFIEKTKVVEKAILVSWM